jgi:hypothetical protein
MVQKLRKAVRLTTTSRVPPDRADLSAHNPRDTPGSGTTRPPESRPITGSYPSNCSRCSGPGGNDRLNTPARAAS